jgi:hypothetical protein
MSSFVREAGTAVLPVMFTLCLQLLDDEFLNPLRYCR